MRKSRRKSWDPKAFTRDGIFEEDRTRGHGSMPMAARPDGNVNSWGLLWKLLSGSCVIRIRSTRGQWFHHRLRHLQHLVEVDNNLSDLEQAGLVY